MSRIPDGQGLAGCATNAAKKLDSTPMRKAVP